MADTSQLEAALVNADKAGDAEAAKALATELRRLTSAPQQSAAERVANDAISQGARNFTQDEGNYLGLKIPANAANTMAGYYKGARDLALGTAQVASPLIGNTAALRQQVAENRQTDAPLMRTKAGAAGELGFNVASIVPTLAIPGVNTVRGAAAIGGAMGLLQPSESGKETLLNTGVGTALGGAGQAAANKVVSATAPAIKSVRDAILAKAQDLGFVVSPSEGRGTVVNKLVTGLGNKQQTAQQASVNNAATHEKIAKADLGWGTGEQLTPENFAATRQQAYESGYKPVEALKTVNWDPQFVQQVKSIAKGESQGAVTRAGQGQIDDLVKQLDRGQWTGKGLVDDIRTLREEGNSNLGKIKSIGDNQLGRAQLSAANALEDLAERNLSLNGAPANLIENFKAARQTIAKTHTIEGAMEGTASINAAKFAKNEADARKLSPEMYAAWKFAKEFPKSNQTPEKVGGIPWNAYVQGAALAGVGGYGSHSPEGAALGVIPFLRGPARSAAMSKVYQSAMVNPATAVGPKLARLGNAPARQLQRIAPQVAATTAMEVE